MQTTIVFVHVWNGVNPNTCGELMLLLKEEGKKVEVNIEVKEIFLSRYISFHDEVRIGDISRAFQSAVNDHLSDIIKNKERFICITHSTGGPVIRDWWSKYFNGRIEICPMSHLIMLAPVNYGTALAQLGKGRLGRLYSRFNRAEPGQGVLDWLELGSAEAWELNKEWILSDGSQIDSNGIFPFVITGQSIDRKFYDNLNSYTGELGSDGIVRVAAANLEARYIKLIQPAPTINNNNELIAEDLELDKFKRAPKTALRVLKKKSHLGNGMGIMMSVKKTVTDKNNSETIKAILDCIQVQSKSDYEKLCIKFEAETKSVQEGEKIEIEDRLLLSDRYFIHDRFSIVIFRVIDTDGHPVNDYDLILTAGENNNPDQLPKGFFADRQRNRLNNETITYFFNYDIMNGTEALKTPDGKVVRHNTKGIEMLGLEINPRPDSGFVKYLPCRIKANKELFDAALNPNSTTLIEICLQRVVNRQFSRL